MIVLDASAVVVLLLRLDRWQEVAAVLEAPTEQPHAPHLLDVEVLHALRRLERAGTIESARAEEAVSDFQDLRVVRHSHEHLSARAWALRHNLTAYDAVYVALAEGLRAPLLTRDRRLADAPGHHAEVRVV